MHELRQIKPLETMERITRRQLCDNFDKVLDRSERKRMRESPGTQNRILKPAGNLTS